MVRIRRQGTSEGSGEFLKVVTGLLGGLHILNPFWINPEALDRVQGFRVKGFGVRVLVFRV